MKPYQNIFLFLAVGTIGLNANWQKIDDFEGTLDGWVHTPAPSALLYLNEDPTDSSNHGYYFNPNTHGSDFGDMVLIHGLPGDGIAKGSSATVYFRFFQEGGSNNVHFGISGVATTLNEDGNATTPRSYGDMSAQINVSALDGTFVIKDGTVDVPISEPSAVPDNTWYEFWVYLKHDSDAFETYYKAPGMNEPALIKIPQYDLDGVQIGTYDDALYRKIVEGPLVNIMIEGNAGWPATPTLEQKWLIDDVYVDYDTTKNLSSPVATSTPNWGGYPIQAGYVYTGTWMGWLYVEDQPWIYSLDMNMFLYIPEPASDSVGSWIYVPNNMGSPNASAPSWGGYPIQEMYVDTGTWMGWLYVENAPWIYSLDLSKYIYIAEPSANSSGSWVYVRN